MTEGRTPTAEELKRYDVNGDGQITVTDSTTINLWVLRPEDRPEPYYFCKIVELNGDDELISASVAKKGISGTIYEQKELFSVAENSSLLDLLWKNASPTSPFGSQTISLNLTHYNFVLIEYKRYCESSNYECLTSLLVVGKGGVYVSTYSSKMIARWIQSSDASSITFNNGAIYDPYGTEIAGATGAQYCIPIKIWGIR